MSPEKRNMLGKPHIGSSIIYSILFGVLSYASSESIADDTSVEQVKYNRDVRPILADHCFRCHGADAAARQAELRLDEQVDAVADRGGYRVIDPGEPTTSELIRRVTSMAADKRMPPHDSGSQLTQRDIKILRQWITDGAEYQSHWSFTRPTRPAQSVVTNNLWQKNAIDNFVVARLADEGLTLSPQADAATLIRRVTLDLTGLPPTIDELDAFEVDMHRNPETAYRRLVDRLLASPRYGERMAVGWLDAARYADTNGYFTDNDRTMWPWRDWVINAFNDNMPFDQFTIEQLAGDLLPDATVDQRIATGFNRNHMVNNETGIIEEEFRVEYVADRVDTTATVWMGLTLGCARCHDHKYDPISQEEFYQFFAFFNNVPEKGLSGSSGNSVPILQVPNAELQRQLRQLQAEVATATARFDDIKKQLDDAQLAWEKTAVAELPNEPNVGLGAHYTLDDELPAASTTGSIGIVSGMIGNAAKFDGDACIQIDEAADFERTDAFSFGGWIQAKSAGCVLSKTDDADEMRGFDITLRKSHAIVNLVHQWNRNAIKVSTTSTIPSGQWQHLMVTYDGSSQAAGVNVYLNGRPQAVSVDHDSLTGSIRNTQPLRIGRRQASASYTGLIDDVRLYDRQLSEQEVHDLATGQLVRGIVSRAVNLRSNAQKQKLRDWFIERHADQALAQASRELDQLTKQERDLRAAMPTTMVMQESDTPRPAFLLIRGQYDEHGEEVSANIPEFLRASKAQAATNRLDLAEWLVDPDHPLTARVTVNRLWQQLFGVGIVKSSDDFGTQGEWPSHPELLDWLAVELVESDWDLKHLLRLIVTSSTYRQSSYCSPELLRLDRENRLLGRGPRIRMDAETLRDNAIAVGGLLSEKLGGPSVYPYQPAGLWEEVTYDSNQPYELDAGESLYRRSLYTFWKRQSPPPNMLVFDAPTRETCTVQRSRTNTPLQSLVLMNDPTFVEAARKLAERMMNDSNDASTRITFGFRAATARRPTADETAILLEIFRGQHEVFEEAQADAVNLLQVGTSTPDESLDTSELAAWTTVASTILSLDETINRP